MIPTIGVIIAVYTFTRLMQILVSKEDIIFIKLIAAVAALATVGLTLVLMAQPSRVPGM